MKNWVNLHLHTVYSMLDGHGQVDAYVKRAAELGLPALAITDHGNIHGWVDFYEAGKAHGVKPILGIEAYQARKTRFDKNDEERAGKANDDLEQRGPYHLTILARNLDGYKNLIKLTSRAYTEGMYVKPRLDLELLAEHSEGLTILSGCLNGMVAQALMRGDTRAALEGAAALQDIVGKEHFFIEVMNHGIPEELEVLPQLVEIAKTLEAPIVPSGDCHYVNRSESSAHDVMLAVSTNSQVDEEDRFKFVPEEFYLKSYEEMAERFPEEWLANTLGVAEQVDVELEFGELYFPSFPLPENMTTDTYLEKLVWEGITQRYGESYSEEVRERTEHELRVVKKMGFQGYFLVVSDLVQWAKDNKIRVGYGRGSAAGSILSYALNITNLDPLRFGLLFERFLVEGRKSMPDIDLDFDDRYRDRVIQYAREKYGSDRVAHIVTFNRVGAKQAIRDAARVLGYEYSTGDTIAKLVPPPVLGVSKTLEEALKSSDFQKDYNDKESTKTIVDAAKGLENLVRQSGMHAAGVVIAQSDITDFVPVMQRANEDEVLITQWDMHRVEQFGQLKIDFLGLSNLGIVDMCVENIREHRGIEIDVDAIPLDDEHTYQNLCAGRSIGTFQLESPGMREMMVALQPTCIEDIMALISLYRPGPLGSGMDKLFIARKHGREEVKADHPVLDELLGSTYGVMLYQEDVLSVARNLAGFSPGEADDLRKAIGKKQMDKIGLFREKFVQGCKDTHDVHPDISNKIYSDIEYFGGYGFNLAHAASYAMMSYVTSYFKFNYPVEYMAALLTAAKTKGEATLYLNECRNMGIEVLPPSINKSISEYKVESDEKILFGLSSINGIGPAVVKSMLDSRDSEYLSVYDFMRRCDPEVLNKGTLEHLFRSGALDELVPEQEERLLPRDEKMKVLEAEREELGVYITEHPLVGAWHVLEESISHQISDLETCVDRQTVTVGGILTKVEEKTTKRGDKMYILRLEDVTGSVQIIVFPRDAKGKSFEDGEIVLITGQVSQEGDEHVINKIFFSEVKRPEISNFGSGQPIIVAFSRQPGYDDLQRMSDLIERNLGDSPVYVNFLDNGIEVSLRFKRPANRKIHEELQLLGKVSLDV